MLNLYLLAIGARHFIFTPEKIHVNHHFEKEIFM